MTVDCSDIDQAVSNAENASSQAVTALEQGQPFVSATQRSGVEMVAIWLLGDIAKSFRRMAVAEEAMAATIPQPNAPTASPQPPAS